MKKLIISILSVILLLSGFAGCTPKKDTIKLVYVPWAEGIAMTNLAAAVIEDEFGIEVETGMAEAGMLFSSLAIGDTDVFMDTWVPVTHKVYIDKYGDDLEYLGTSYTEARIGIVVPEYVPINTIEELKSLSDEFDNKIVGIDPGAGIMGAASNAIEAYGLDSFSLQTSSDAAMTASLGDAIEKSRYIAVTGWAPHWKFSRWNLKFLEDSKGVFGGQENIDIYSRKGFSSDYPEIARLFANIKFSDESLGSLIDAVENASGSQKEAARKWASENSSLIAGWLS